MRPIHQLALAQLALALFLAAPAAAQYNPAAGQWGKTDPADVRIATWNVQDGLCSSSPKSEANNSWCAIARIVAALKPDVLILQECGDNTGNGTGSGIDSVATLTTTVNLFLNGGTDTFNGGVAVGAWVKKYAPAYDLPHVYISGENDGFNRNVILSRFPFADLNGDGKSTYADIATVTAHLWAPGGDGGIRGFAFAELDLPAATYQGNLVVGNAHLKSGGTTSDAQQRLVAAQNVSYYVRHFYNGGGTASVDPFAKIADSPVATSVLPATTPVVLGGDWNEDELGNGTTRGPAEWLAKAQTVGGTSDGVDRDGSDAAIDGALHWSTGSDASFQNGSKLDYVVWQDSIATLRNQGIFISGSNSAASQPAEIAGFAGGASGCSSAASDHRMVYVDLRLPIVDCNQNGIADTTDIATGFDVDANANQIPDGCECLVQTYCIAAPNSVGPGASIAIAGSTSVAANNLLLQTQGLPPGAAGLYYFGLNAVQQPFGNGYRCVSGSVYRFSVQNADFLGTLNRAVNFTQAPAAGVLVPGSTWRFQLWYRNPAGGGAGFNLSDGVRVGLCP
jgi:endonuclease/exonuclease/phosphatase family metal-dependent hydrolase